MKPQQIRLIRAALAGAASGFVFMLVVILFSPGGVQQPGEENFFNACVRAINTPMLWLAQGGMGNTPIMIVGFCAYWALLGGVAAMLLSCLSHAASRRHAHLAQEPDQPTKPGAGRALRVAVIGAGSGLVFAFAVWLAEPSQSGERGILGTFIRWLNMPVVWALDWALQRGLVENGNIQVFLAIYFLYWISLGVLVVMVGYYFRRSVLGRHRRTTGSA
jgi:hypothetical protein